MKKLLPLCSSLALAFALSSPVRALVIDAPHNDSNDVHCATCHSYSLWWKYSPTNQSTNPGHTAVADEICINCHDGTHDQPWALTHSSTVIGSVAHGVWEVGCTECHNPHFQEQLTWIEMGSDPYLVTGTIGGISYAEPPLNQTTITFTGATANANWPPVGAQGTDPDWANKSVDNPGRGLILIHDTALRTGTYSIVSASSTQVVVKGRLDATAIDPSYVDPQTQLQNPPTCNSFGLIYGQLIKSSIAAKPVKFFDPNGGFVQEGTGTTGICQVCHTATSRFANDGVLPSGSDSHLGRETANCSTCHNHDTGFKGGGIHGTSSFAWAGNCAVCHNPDNTTVAIVRDIHGDTCGTCHLNSAGGGARKDGDPANGVDGTALGAIPTSTCLDCHLTVPALTSSAIHHDSVHGYAVAGNCTQCHQDTAGKLVADHSAAIATSADCVNCHAQTVGTAAGAPVDPVDARIHDACITCHESNGALKAAYGTAGAMPAGGGNCEACHGAYFNSHDHGTYGGTIDHTVAVDPVNDYFNYYDPACNGCHAVQNWPNILATHLGACGTCHNATRDIWRSEPTGTTVPMIIANANRNTVNCLDCHMQHLDMHAFRADGNCTSCHFMDYGIDIVIRVHSGNCELCHIDAFGGGPLRAGTDGSAIGAVGTSTCTACHNTTTYPRGFVHHDTQNAVNGNCTACHNSTHSGNHATAVADSANCNGCHQATAGTANGVPVNAADNMVHDSCLTCHDTDGSLLPVAVANNPTTPATVIAMVAGTCEACHGAYFIVHTNPDHSAIHDNGYCEGCHPGSPATALALHGSCMTCHNANGTWKLGPTPFPDTSTQVYPGPGACDACHGNYFVLHLGPNHMASVAASANCVGCHTTAAGSFFGIQVDSQNNMIHDSCSTCHDTTTGALRAAYGTATAMPAGGGTCEACHGDYFANHTAANHAAAVAASATCNLSTCHPAVDVVGTATGLPIDPANNKVHDACTTCHAADGTLVAPYGKVIDMPTTGGTCEACHGGYSHPGYVHVMPAEGLCLNCHNAATAPYVTSGEVHGQAGCATCHNMITGVTIGSAAGKSNGASCEDCHGNFHPPFDHITAVRTNSALSPTTANCSGCHQATLSPFVAAGQAHAAIGCQGCHSQTDGSLIGSAAGHTGGGECVTCHSAYFNGHSHGSTHDVLMRSTDINITYAAPCNLCHRRGGVASGNPLFVNSWTGPEGILALHQNSCALCHDSTRTTNVSAPYTSVNDAMTGVSVSCLDCHADSAGDHPPGLHDFVWDASCQTCHGIGSVSTAAPKGEIDSDVHSNACGLCHLGGLGGNPLIGSAASATVGVKPHPCSECHTGGFDSHSHGSGSNHDVLMRGWDLADGTACNDCHRGGGTGSSNPLFTNTWAGLNGILALHQNSCALCHSSTRTDNIVPGYTSVNEIIMIKSTVGCLDCHQSHPDPHNFTWDGNCSSCHPNDYGVDVHNAQCALCHVSPAGGGARRTGSNGDATAAVSGQPASCLTCHDSTTYPSNKIHHDTNLTANNDCASCHAAVDHSALTAPAICVACHTNTAGSTTGMPVDMANSRVHDACRSCHTFNPITLAGELVAPTGNRGVTAMIAGPCTVCHTGAATSMHHNANAHALIGECEYCHTDPRNAQGGMIFQETSAVPNPIPTHLPCEECHVTPKRGVNPGINGWTASAGQMTIYAYTEGSSHSTTNYSSDFARTVAHSGGHVIGNTAGRINNWGICFSCHGSTAVPVRQFHAKPTALTATNLSCGASGTSAFAPGREARNTIGNFDFFASTFRPASTRPGGTGSCRQTGDWSGTVKYGSTIYAASDLVVPDPWSTATNTVPIFPAQTPNTTITPAADNVKVTTATWDGSNIMVTATNTDGCAALTAVYNGNSQPFAGTTTCTATFAAGVVYTPAVPTLDVTTTNPDGLGVTGFRISVP